MRPLHAVISGPRAAFTLAELLLAVGLGASLLGTLALLGQRASATTSERTAESHSQRELDSALARVRRELADAGSGTLDPSPEHPFWTDTLDFQTPAGFDEGGTVWSAPRRLALVDDPADPPNRLDDDGDGVIDERRLQLITEDGARRIVLASQVRALGLGEFPNGEDDDGDGLIDEPGFCITREGNGLRVELTIEVPDAREGTVLANGVASSWLEN